MDELAPIEIAKLAWKEGWKDRTEFGKWTVITDRKTVTLVEKPNPAALAEYKLLHFFSGCRGMLN